MGDLIVLPERRGLDCGSGTASSARPVFYFDLACPFSYLAAERVERVLGEVDWVPVPSLGFNCESGALEGAPGALDCEPGTSEPGSPPLGRARAERRAAELRLPLVWPDRHPAGSPSALRAASYAAEVGAGARFALAASRLAFCGGFELEDPEVLAEAAAAAGIGLEPCLAAAGDPARDGPLQARRRELLTLGATGLPAVRIGRRCVQGESALEQAAWLSHACRRGTSGQAGARAPAGSARAPRRLSRVLAPAPVG